MTLKPKEVTLSDCRELSEAVKGPSLIRSMLKEREEMLNEIAHLPGMRKVFNFFYLNFIVGPKESPVSWCPKTIFCFSRWSTAESAGNVGEYCSS